MGRQKDRLKAYRDKRDFRSTPEPQGGNASGGGRAYVIQKHWATRTHFDLRLEHGGTLLSWAVTRGPSLDPADRRLAVRTEDHPVDYAAFEGVIPEGHYGAGTVMLWDTGSWTPEGDVDAALEEGKLAFAIEGERLKGKWALVRMGGGGRRENWLLIKQRDAQAHEDLDVTAEYDTSVATGRDRAAIEDKGEVPGEGEETIAGVALTSPDKVMFPKQGVTKRDLAAYYAEIAEWILPQLDRRLVSFVRCPEGREEECFYQRHPGESAPEAFETLAVKQKDGKTRDYIHIDGPAGLIAAVQLGVLEFHIWGSRIDRLDRPDRLVFDLDPAEGLGFEAVRQAARDVRELLEGAGLKSFVMTTGGKGLHVVVPVERRHDWASAKEFTRACAKALAEAEPGRYIAEASKEKRRDRIFIDYLRNDRGNTAICPYSTRRHPGAPVATPIAWDELSGLESAADWTLDNIRRRLAQLKSDPWAEMTRTRQRLSAKALESIERTGKA